MSGMQDSIQETVALIKNDQNNRAYFFSKAKDPKWFEPLRAAGFFEPDSIPQPVKTEKGFTLSFWPQQGYLEQLSTQIQTKSITDKKFIERFLEVLRKITSTGKNFFLGRSLFLIIMKIPLAHLETKDIELAFKWLLESDASDTLVKTTAHEGLDLILAATTDEASDRALFREFAKHFLAIYEEEKHRGRDPKLIFFDDWSYNEFRQKHFNVEQLVRARPFVLFDTIDVATTKLMDILSASDLDNSTQWWRPAIEEHHQNNFHDSAQAIIVGIVAMSASALVTHGHSLPQLDDWRKSPFKTFNRLYIFLAAESADTIAEEAASRILELDFAYECMHEIYHFLTKKFDHLPGPLQDKILDHIEKISTDYSEDDEINKRQTAWEKLRWLEAISSSKNEKVIKLRTDALALTDNGIPEHPDFGSYMGATWVGPTSPKDEKWLSTASLEDILNLLLTFKNSSAFASPSIEGLSRVLEAWVLADPMRASALIKEFNKLNAQYISSLLDGYSKCWTEKKYVPLAGLIESIKSLIAPAEFFDKVADVNTRMCWVITSICRFIEAGTRNDDNAFDPGVNNDCYLILKRCLELSPADTRFEKSSDAHSRAINEPRGQVFEALVVLTLRRARLAGTDANAFAQAWNDLRSLIEPILQSQDDREVSLHAHIGVFYRQFQFLSKDWLIKNIDLIAPSPSQKPMLWRSFMDGFSYVTDYSRDVYLQLKNRGYLLNYLRLDVNPEDKSSRLDRLQTRMIELSLVAYVLGDESLDEGIIATILKEKDPQEWHQMIWSVQSIIGNNPKPEHLAKAKGLISKLIEIRDSDSSGETFEEHFKGLGRFLDLIKDPSDAMVAKIITIVAADKESPWELGDIVDYLHEFKDSHAKIVGDLFKLLLTESKSAPAWPQDKMREISLSLLKHGERETMIFVCRTYSDRSPTCEPIRDICAGIGKK